MPKHVEMIRTKCQPKSWDRQNANHKKKSGQNGILSGWHFVRTPYMMNSYEIQSDRIHRNHSRHSNLENRWFCYIIWAKSPKLAKRNSKIFFWHYSIQIIGIFLIYFLCLIDFFAKLRVPTVKNVAGPCVLNFSATALPHSLFKRYTPKFSGGPQKLAWCQRFGVHVLPKSGNLDCCPPK